MIVAIVLGSSCWAVILTSREILRDSRAGRALRAGFLLQRAPHAPGAIMRRLVRGSLLGPTIVGCPGASPCAAGRMTLPAPAVGPHARRWMAVGAARFHSRQISPPLPMVRANSSPERVTGFCSPFRHAYRIGMNTNRTGMRTVLAAAAAGALIMGSAAGAMAAPPRTSRLQRRLRPGPEREHPWPQPDQRLEPSTPLATSSFARRVRDTEARTPPAIATVDGHAGAVHEEGERATRSPTTPTSRSPPSIDPRRWPARPRRTRSLRGRPTTLTP